MIHLIQVPKDLKNRCHATRILLPLAVVFLLQLATSHGNMCLFVHFIDFIQVLKYLNHLCQVALSLPCVISKPLVVSCYR